MSNANLNVSVTQTGAGQVQKDISAIGKEATSAGYAVRSLNHLLGVIGIATLISQVAEWGDEWQNIHNKLLNVTTGLSNLNAVNEALFQGAQKSRTAYGEFVNVFQEMAIQAKRFGTSQQQLVDITTTMERAAQLAHPSLAAMKMGVEQLILSMERGRLQTRAFSAMLKDTPQLAKALADGLGIGINQLRELAHHSKLTSAEIVNGLEKVGPRVAQEFAKLDPTFENSMTVLHNGWIKFIGDLDQSTGIIGGLTSLIIGLANHVDALAVAIVAVGAVALVAFGGVAAKAITAMWTAFVATGPVGWALAAIAAIAAALAIFGDKVAVTSDGFVSLLDVVKGVFDTIVDYVRPVATWIGSAFMQAWAVIVDGAQGVPNGVGAVLVILLEGIKGAINLIIGVFRFMFDAVMLIWNELGLSIPKVMGAAYTAVNQATMGFLDVTIDALKQAGKAWDAYSAGVAKSKQSAGDKTADPNAIGGKGFFSQLGALAVRDIGNAGHLHDYVGNFASDVMKNARAHATARHANTGGGIGTDHGLAENDPDPTKKHHGGGHAKTRAELIAEETKKYVDQTADANDLSLTPWTDAAAKEVTRFNDQLMKTKDKKGHFMPGLSPEEKASMLALIQTYEDANRVQQERFALLNEFLGPQVKYQDQLKAISQLESTHALTAEQAARAERDAAIAFLGTKFDAASGAMLGQLNILKEMSDLAHPLADAMKSVWDTQQGPLRAYQTQLEAINALLHDQLITAKQAAVASRDAAISYLDTQTDGAAGVTRALLKIQKTADDVASQMEQTINDAFNGLQDAWVALMTGQKFDAKGALKTIQTDLAKSSFQQAIGPLAGFLQQRFGISIPGLQGKLGESSGNPMWVRNVDAPGLPGADSVGRGDSANIQSIMSFLGVGGSSSSSAPLAGNTAAWDQSFGRFNTDLDKTLGKGSVNLGASISAGVALLGGAIGSLIGGKAGGIIGTVISVGASIAESYFAGGGKFATGGGFTVGGAGGVDSQLVQFHASPGERVSIGRDPGQGAVVNYYDVQVDARGASDVSIEDRVNMAVAQAIPQAEKKSRAAALNDVAKMATRQRLAGAR